MKKFRENGAIGALLDEYEKSVEELKEVIRLISSKQLIAIVDPDTKDPDCYSIQTILRHVIGAGFGYIEIIRNHLGESVERPSIPASENIQDYVVGLDKMFAFNVQFFEDYPNVELEQYDANLKMVTHWGQRYDVEQLIEHAICHVLRHRRQIERFLIKLENI